MFIVLRKETAFARCRATDRRWNRKTVSLVSWVIININPEWTGVCHRQTVVGLTLRIPTGYVGVRFGRDEAPAGTSTAEHRHHQRRQQYQHVDQQQKPQVVRWTVHSRLTPTASRLQRSRIITCRGDNYAHEQLKVSSRSKINTRLQFVVIIIIIIETFVMRLLQLKTNTSVT